MKAGKYVFQDASNNIVKELNADEMQAFLKELDVDLGDVTLNNVKVQEITYVKRSSAELQILRTDFNTTTRKAFLEDLGQDVEYLINAGFSETVTLKIQTANLL